MKRFLMAVLLVTLVIGRIFTEEPIPKDPVESTAWRDAKELYGSYIFFQGLKSKKL